MKTKIVLIIAITAMVSFTVGSKGNNHPKSTVKATTLKKETKQPGFEMVDADQWR